MAKKVYDFIVYIITNLVNNKIYVGVHGNTVPNPYDFDGYLGSSEIVDRARVKYGDENFRRITLFVYDNKKEAYAKEAIIVDKEFVGREDTYNICGGGEGCSYCSDLTRQKISEITKGPNNSMFGKRQTEETKKKIMKSRGITEEVIKQRLLDIEKEPKTFGWRARLSKKWGLTPGAINNFIQKHTNIFLF